MNNEVTWLSSLWLTIKWVFLLVVAAASLFGASWGAWGLFRWLFDDHAGYIAGGVIIFITLTAITHVTRLGLSSANQWEDRLDG